MGNLVIAMPAWFIDRLMPLLTPQEFKVATYIATRTWSRRKPWAVLTYAQMVRGSWVVDDRLDYGTGMSHNVVKSALEPLKKYKIVVEVRRRREMKGLVGMPLRLGWYGEINWDGLQYRKSRLKADRVLRLGELDPEMAWLEQKPPEYVEKVKLIEDVFDNFQEQAYREILEKREEERVQKEIEGKPFPGYKEQPQGEYIPGVAYPKNRAFQEPEYLARARRMGVDSAVAVQISQALLDITGRSELADQDTDYGYKALSEAHQGAVTVIGLGRRTVAAVQALGVLWDNGWQAEKARQDNKPVPKPTMKQVIDLAAANPPGPYEYKEQENGLVATNTAVRNLPPPPPDAQPENFTMLNLFD